MSRLAGQQSDTRRARGIEIGAAAVRLVELERGGETTRVVRYASRSLPDRWEGEPDWADAIAALLADADAEGAAGTAGGAGMASVAGLAGVAGVGLTVADEAVLYRSLTLPPAGGEALEQMIRAQVDVVLPAASEVLAWSWMVQQPGGPGQPQRVLIAAMRQAMLGQLKGAVAQPGGTLLGVTPAAVACGRGLAALTGGAAGAGSARVLVELAGEATTVLLHDPAGSRLEIESIGHGRDHWIEALADEMEVSLTEAERRVGSALRSGGATLPEAVGLLIERWAGQVAAVVRGLIGEGDDGQDDATTDVAGVHLIGEAGASGYLAQELGGAMGGEVTPLPRPAQLVVPGDVAMGEALPALGAALEALEPGERTINFAPPQAAIVRQSPRLVKLAAAAAVWVLLAVLLLYAMDRGEAARLDAALAEARSRVATSAGGGGAGGGGGGDAVVRYLEQSVMPPLHVLLELTSFAPDSLVLRSWQYDREGTIRLAGRVGSIDDLDGFLKAIDGSPMFARVELRQARAQERAWELELTAEITALNRYIPPPPPAPAAPEADDAGEADDDEEPGPVEADAQDESTPVAAREQRR
ncbi:MAG: PilN domain-containing protein [Phycisphaeraceae bacterium]